MPVKNIHEFQGKLSLPVFCFNKDLSRLAFSPNNELVHVYSYVNKKWELGSTLTEHSERVTGIDWGQETNKILTCGADRNAYVWKEERQNEWKQALVLLRINRAAITAKWAPGEKKFAVGTGSKLICVCYYEEGNDWWVSKHIKKPIRSSVLCVDWHPTGTVLACGSSDFKVRLYGAGVKEIEKKPEPTKWGDKVAFGALLVEFGSQYGGWVHSVSFSPDGNSLVWTAHDATISVATASQGEPTAYVLKLSFLPFLVCKFVNSSTIVAGGHDNTLYKFTYADGKIEGGQDLDTKKAKTETAATSAMARFKNLDKMAQSGAVTSKAHSTTHGNTITCLHILSSGETATSGLDNKIAIWEKA